MDTEEEVLAEKENQGIVLRINKKARRKRRQIDYNAVAQAIWRIEDHLGLPRTDFEGKG